MEPIKEANRKAFEDIRDRVMAELEGEIDPSEIVTSYDLYPSTRPVVVLTAADSVRMRVESGGLYKALGSIK